MLGEAVLEAARAQYETARLVGLPADGPLPLPADRPHVGPYRTYYRELFAGRAAPEPAPLLDRILPIRLQTIEELSAAVEAAEDVAADADDALRGGASNLSNRLARAEDLLQNRRALLRAACQYNREIAEYALTVVSPSLPPRELTAVLIGPTAAPAAATASAANNPHGRPAGTLEPMADPLQLPARHEATAAPLNPPGGWKATESRPVAPVQAEPNGPTPAKRPPPAGERPPWADANDPAAKPIVPVEFTEPATQAVVEKQTAAQPPPAVQNRAGQSTTTDPPALRLFLDARQERTAQKPTESATFAAGSDRGEAGASPAAPLFAAAAEADPALRAKRLALALYENRAESEKLGAPIDLTECLMRAAGGDRRATIEAYWLLRQRTAEYHWLRRRCEWLDALTDATLDRRGEPTGASEMLRLRAAQASAQAAKSAARAALLEAQYALALRIGMAGEEAWPLASTAPHAGQYLLRLDAQPRALAASWPVRRLATTIPALGETMRRRADAVVEADAARAAAVERYRAAEVPLDGVLESIEEQTRNGIAFLNALTEYNRAIAEYALTVLPPAASADRLAAALVVKEILGN